MKKPTKRKIVYFLLGNLYEFKISIPTWLVAFIILLPLLAYADVVLFGKVSFFDYLVVCALELFLMYLGFMMASNVYEWKLKQT